MDIRISRFEERLALSESGAPESGYSFQAILHSLMSQFKQAHQLMQADLFSDASPCFLDYLVEASPISARLLMSRREADLFDTYFDIMMQRVPLPDLIVYLRASTDVLMERLALAEREDGEIPNREFVDSVNRAYDDFFMNYKRSSLLIVDTDEADYRNVPRDFHDFCQDLEWALQDNGMGSVIRLTGSAAQD